MKIPKAISATILRTILEIELKRLSNSDTDIAIRTEDKLHFRIADQSSLILIWCLNSFSIKVKPTVHIPTRAMEAPRIPKRGDRRRTKETFVTTFATPIFTKAFVSAIAFKADIRI